ncbi:aminoacyl-tRNA deacylase [Paenibacillus tengchongensis]|uniref:aminoacyl-tRNA deacylase n=1 Tax=Paenibacillus tengchongensis TaxID=2608684 RepID=UPI001FE856BB|nr:YbaK/EbsC family protein [Paenibacillus tengchongensis]
MTVSQISELLKLRHADFEILQHEKPIHTLADAAMYFNTDLAVPNLIIRTERGYYALLVSGSRGQVVLEGLKAVLDCEVVKMAGRKEVFEQTGAQPGEVPLIGLGLPYIFDNRILEHDDAYGGIGDPYCTLRINPRDLKAIVSPVAELD